MKFSQRHGYSQMRTEIQLESIDDDLRTMLWNLLSLKFWPDLKNQVQFPQSSNEEMYRLFRNLWIHYFNKPIDEFFAWDHEWSHFLKEHFYNPDEWYVPYNFLEATLQCSTLSGEEVKKFTETCNLILEQHISGYRLVNGLITPIIDQEQIGAVNQALANEQDPISKHLNKALTLLSNKTGPDYENSIKESISAVESKIKQVLGDGQVTANRGLVKIAEQYRLHPALKKGFEKLYAYTSDEDGIRHGRLHSKAISQAEAIFFLVSCSAFVSYLTAITTRGNQA